jgi:membrane-bound lytic murein transglycosylase B
MIGMYIEFSLNDEVKNQMDQNAVRNHMANVVALYKQVPGLKEKTFFMNPDNLDQGAFLVWENQELLDQYLKSDLYKTAVLDICKGDPSIRTYVITASLKDGVLI